MFNNAKEFKPKRIIGYIRVSTNYQKDISPNHQLETMKNYINFKQWKDIEFIYFADIGISAKNDKRPEFQKMINLLKSNDLILVYSLSRLSRNLKNTLELFQLLESKNVKLSSLTEQLSSDSSMGKFFVNLIASLNQLEIEQIGQRVSMTMREMIRNGQMKRKPTYGWMAKRDEYGKIVKNHPYIEVPEEQEVIKSIVDMYQNKNFTLMEITEKLRLDGVKPPKSAKQFYVGLVRNILWREGVLKLQKT